MTCFGDEGGSVPGTLVVRVQPGCAELVAAGPPQLVARVLRFDGMFFGILCKAEGKTVQLEVVCKGEVECPGHEFYIIGLLMAVCTLQRI